MNGTRRHVYRKRRLGALATTVLAAAVAGALHAGSWAGAEAPPVRYTVAPGDTLWSIVAEHYPPSEDPRVMVEEVRDENGLEGYLIRPGARLELPAAD